MAVADVPFDLVQVKLAAPQPRPGTTAKRDLIERLCRSQVACVSVVAPAGYGKTTLLAMWAEADQRAFAWVALDGVDDDDVVMFLRYIAAAIHSVEPISPEVFAALSGPGDQPCRSESRASGARWRRSSGRWCWCSTICTPSESVVPRCHRGAARVPPGRRADRGREPGGARPAACALASPWLGTRDRRRRSPVGQAGGRAAAGCRGRAAANE